MSGGYEPPDGAWTPPDGGMQEQPPTRPPGEDEGLLETVVGVFVSPVATLRRVTREQNLAWAFIVLVALGVLSGIASYAQLTGPPDGLDPFTDPTFADPVIARALAVGTAVATPFLTVVFAALIALVLHGMAKLFKGEGTYSGMLCGVAFAYVPSVINVLVALLVLTLGFLGALLAGFVSFAISIWVIILVVVAVRENYALTTGRAAGAVLIPIGALFLLGIMLAVLVALLFFAAGP
jgi:hypothetical protein